MRVRDVLVAVCVMALMTGGAACTAKDNNDSGVASAGGAGASGGTQPAGTPGTPGTGGDRQKWLVCLQEQGIKIVDGKPDYSQMDKDKIPAAERACAQYDTPDDLARPLTTAEIEMYRKWAQCMRDKGIDMGDPDPSIADGRPMPRSTRSSLEDLRRAQEACENLAVPTQGLGR
ncbi:MAG TPA: hypothetical protein VFC19_19685 [Candidatus Limnocylindrales bacterium]|nr:hypothetical protein [Candidatus Limnocylindrales bacterium]